jgi:Ca-activated chloride channel family protein
VRFGESNLLWGLSVLPLFAIAFAIFFARRRRLLERLGDAALIARMTASVSPRRRRFKKYLCVLALALGVLALARPQLGARAKLTKQYGLDVVVALDFSRSMLAKDAYPTRLERSKRELERLLDELVGDRVGMVAFAGETIAYPLTSDYNAIKLFFRNLAPKDLPGGGTNIGQAIRTSVDMLRRARGATRRAQVIVLVTDGEDTTGEPLAAARQAAAEGIKIYAIGIGSPTGELVPSVGEGGELAGYLRGPDGELVTSRLDEGRLRRVAQVTSGDYFQVDPRRFGVDAVRIALGALQRAEHEARVVRQYDEGYHWFLFPMYMLLLLEAVTGDRRRAARAAALSTAPPIAPAPRLPPRTGTGSLTLSGASLMTSRAGLLVLLLPLLFGFDLLRAPNPLVEDGNRELREGRAAAALALDERALGELPHEPGLHFDRGSALYALGKFDEAQREFLRATEARDPGLKGQGFYNMGNAFYRSGKFAEAAQAYTRSLGLDPKNLSAKWNLELSLRAQKQEEERAGEEQARREQERKEEERRQKEEEESKRRAREESQAEGPSKGSAEGPPDRPMTLDDAETILDALEQNERTLQQELARRRAAHAPKVERDW